mgnify:CR=1 FL=1
MFLEIRAPESQQEWDDYFDMRWRLLRKDWDRPRGSEKDEDEDLAIHAALYKDGVLCAVSRLQINNADEGQFRYMAVEALYQGEGLGKKILFYLEDKAREEGLKYMLLNARDNALSFYKSCGYKMHAESYLLYGIIPHFEMRKALI